MRQLVHVVKISNKGILANAPKILLLAAPAIREVPNLTPQRDDASIKKSQYLVALYQQIAEEEGCSFLDTSVVVTSSTLDGVHLDGSENKLLGYAIAKKVKQILVI